MGEILGLGVTHYPPLIGTDENMAGILRAVLADPGLPEPYRDPASWPEPMRREYGDDGGTAAATAHRAELVRHFRHSRKLLDEFQPDVVVIIYNDHGLNFFLDKLPTFAIGAAPEYRSADEGWNIPTVLPFTGDPGLSWHVITSVVAEDFDITICQEEMVVDHAVCNPMGLLWPGGEPWPVRVVPVEINTIQFPLPSAARCYHLGEAIGRAIAAYPSDLRVLVMGTGGLSHQLDGERAGFINKEFDQEFMASLTADPEWATQYSTLPLPLPMRTSMGFWVIGLSGNTRIQSLPPRLT